MGTLANSDDPDEMPHNRVYTTVFVLFCFVALHPKSTAMVMVGQSVHLTTLFPGQA